MALSAYLGMTNFIMRIGKGHLKYFQEVFPKLKEIDFTELSHEEALAMVRLNCVEDFKKNMLNGKEKCNIIQEAWDEINDEVMIQLSEILNIKWPEDCKVIDAMMGKTYNSPRYIKERAFTTDIDFQIEGIKNMAIHESCHFLYFEKWKELNPNWTEADFEFPSLSWYLSEAIIDPLLNNDGFNKFTAYPLTSYEKFYTTKVGDKSIVETLNDIVANNSIEDTIPKAYSFFQEHETLIRGNDPGAATKRK